MNGLEIVAKAEEFLGTPFHFGARLKQVGIDCAGLIVCVFAELGGDVGDARGYHEGDQFDLLYRILSSSFVQVFDAQAGDVLLFRRMDGPASRRIYSHVGIVTASEPLSMIHAYPGGAKPRVLEIPLGPYFTTALLGTYRYKSLA